MKNSRTEIIAAIEQHKIIVILRGLAGDEILKTVSAMRDGGIRFVEVTFDQTKSISDEETCANIKKLCESFPDMYIGAGTVLSTKQVAMAKKAGAKYIISPDVNKNVIKKTVKSGLVSLPGALTPTEAASAYRYGADFVKLFPNSEMKPTYLKAISAPLSHIKFLAVGGVNVDNVKDFLKNGAKGIGASSVANKDYIKNGEYNKITELAKAFVAAIN